MPPKHSSSSKPTTASSLASNTSADSSQNAKSASAGAPLQSTTSTTKASGSSSVMPKNAAYGKSSMLRPTQPPKAAVKRQYKSKMKTASAIDDDIAKLITDPTFNLHDEESFQRHLTPAIRERLSWLKASKGSGNTVPSIEGIERVDKLHGEERTAAVKRNQERARAAIAKDQKIQEEEHSNEDSEMTVRMQEEKEPENTADPSSTDSPCALPDPDPLFSFQTSTVLSIVSVYPVGYTVIKTFRDTQGNEKKATIKVAEGRHFMIGGTKRKQKDTEDQEDERPAKKQRTKKTSKKEKTKTDKSPARKLGL